jgi:hypothetical protein
MKHFAGFLLLGAILSAPLHAASADEDATAETPAPAKPGTATNQPDEKSSNKLKKKTKVKSEEKDIFRPSEEISEDFAVPFPVDI